MRTRALLGLLLLAAASCSGGGGSSGAAPGEALDTSFGAPAHVRVSGYAGELMEPFLSRDGQTLFFNNRNDPPDATDLHVATRVDDLTFSYLHPLAGASSARLDAVASADASGRLYFVSLRSYDTTLVSVFAGDLSAGDVTNVTAVAGISRLTPGSVNFDAEVAADGQTLYYVDGRFTGGPVPDAADILVAAKTGAAAFAPLPDAGDLMREVNTADLEYAPALTADELEIFFTRLSRAPGAAPQLYHATRAARGQPFGAPRRIAAASGFVEGATVTPDGRALYYHALEAGRFVLLRIAR